MNRDVFLSILAMEITVTVYLTPKSQTLTVPMIVGGLYLILTANRRRQRVEPIAGGEGGESVA